MLLIKIYNKKIVNENLLIPNLVSERIYHLEK